MPMQCSRAIGVAILLAGCARLDWSNHPAPVVLAGARDGVSRPYGVVVDDGRVYWTERGLGGAIRSVGKSGGPVRTLVRGTSPYAWFCAADDRWIYWTEFDAGTLRRVAKTGGLPETLVHGCANPGQLAVRNGWVYWVEYSGNVIRRRRTGGTESATTMVRGLAGPQAIAVDDTAVYWTEFADPSLLRRRPLAGGPVVTLAIVKPECWLVPAGPWLWWTETHGSLRRVVRNGGPVQDLAPIISSGAFAAASSSYLYWAEEHGHVMKRVPLAGGAPETILQRLPHPAVMAADENAVYWSDPELNAILRLTVRP